MLQAALVLRQPRLSRAEPGVAMRVALAAALGLATVPGAYAWVRGLEVLMFPRENPLAIVAVTQSGFFVRCAAAVFAGGMAAFAGWALGARPARAARVLAAVVAVSAAALAAQIGIAP